MMFRFYLMSLLLVTLAAESCTEKQASLFSKLDNATTNITFQNTLFEDGPLNVSNYIYFYNGGGVSVGDINNDGLQDILFTGNMVKNRLYLNKGNFQFEDITQQSGVAEKQGWCTGATMVDINGDGKLDIYICRSADINPKLRQNLLFINNGDLTFSEKAEQFGLANDGYSTQAAFFDYDKDGDLDCFVINHSLQKYTTGVQDNPELRNKQNPDFANKLYQNNDNHFTDVSGQAGIISNVLSFGLGLAVSDINNDGWPDIYVSNDFNEHDYLFTNNRNGTFTESVSKRMDEVPLYSMGSDAADFNNDGLIDIATLDMAPEDNEVQKMHNGAENFDKFQNLFSKGFYYQYSRNMLQKNNGDGTFSEVGQLANVSNTDWSWSALFGDYDNDGYKDLFVTNGYVKDYTDMDFLKYSVDRVIRTSHNDQAGAVPEYISKMPTIKIPNYIFKNNGDETFTKVSREWGMDEPGVSSGAVYADLDNDGDLDLVINNTNDYASVYRNNNESVAPNNFLRIRLHGTPGNESGIGARVKVFCKGQQYYQEQMPVRGFQSSSDPILHFGTGRNAVIDSVVVVWPTDALQKLVNVKAGQTLTMSMADAREKWIYDTSATASNTLMAQATLPGVVHRENPFNDFTVQTLLPGYLSRNGPCIEVADVNNDGLEDFFIGGAKNKPSQIFLQNKTGTFINKPEAELLKDSLSEDVAAFFFDADGDGDKDLYVGSGGYEFPEGDAALQDRLYINDSKGIFSRKEKALPVMHISTGCVKGADIDSDGDIDLFVGGRLVPGKYPVSPESKILLNDGKGNFADATATVAPLLQKTGMVTDAVWTDINNDKAPDLVVAGEWMPIKIFINQAGRLVDQSSSFIHFASTGWWNTISAEDMDGDGDTDLIVGNCGLNTQFKVNEKEPMTMYYADFDGNGSLDPVLCYYVNGTSYPVASRDDLTDQLPGLKKKFLDYEQYSKATIHDLFTEDQLRKADTLRAENMQSIYLENVGAKGLVPRPLPAEAQYSPVYAIAAADLDRDGKKDLLLGGNNTWTRIKFGRYSANHGTLLVGNGRGNFKYIPQSQSGLNLRGNVRSLKRITTGRQQNIICGINDSDVKILKVK